MADGGLVNLMRLQKSTGTISDSELATLKQELEQLKADLSLYQTKQRLASSGKGPQLVEGAINDLYEKISNLSSSIDGLNIGDIIKAIEDINSRITTIFGDITTLSNNVNVLNTNVSNLQNDLNNKQNINLSDDTVSQLNMEGVTTVEGALIALKSNSDSKQYVNGQDIKNLFVICNDNSKFLD